MRFRKIVDNAKRTTLATVNSMGLFGAGFIVVMMVSVTIDVACRYIFNAPLKWVYEITGYLMVAVTYLALGYTEAQEGHVSIGILVSRFSAKTQAIIKIVTRVPILVFVFFLIWTSFHLTWQSFETHARSYHINQMYLWPSQLLVPIGGLLLFLEIVVKISGYIRTLQKGEP